MAQLGQANLGSLTPNAGVPNVFSFLQSMPRGMPLSRIAQRIAFTLISTAGAFNLAVDTQGSAATEGTDDTDVLLNLLFTQWFYEWSAGLPVGSALSPARWRTIFGAINRRDYEGTFANGVSVPASTGTAKALYIDVLFPVSMAKMFKGGGITTRGSDAMRDASWTYTAGASVTPNAVLTNGTATVAGLTISLVAYAGIGTGGDVGPTWDITLRNINLPYDFPEAQRLALLDTTPNTSYSGGAISLWENINASPNDFETKYQADVLGDFGATYDVSARVLPYYMIRPEDDLNVLATRLGQPTRLEVATGITSTTVYDLTLREPHAASVANVGGQVGNGGPVATSRVRPAHMSEGLAASLSHLAPIRVQPAAVGGPAAAIHANAQSAAEGAHQANASAAGVRATLASLFTRR